MGAERFIIGSFTIPIVKRSFLKRIFIFFSWEKKEHFTIGKKKKTTVLTRLQVSSWISEFLFFIFFY